MKFRSPLFFVLFVFSALACSSSSDSNEPVGLVQLPKHSDEILIEEAMRAYDRGLFRLSRETLTELRNGYPGSHFATLAELKIADCYFYERDYPAALIAYEEFERLHPTHDAIPYIKFQIANSQLEQYKGPTRDQAPLIAAINSFKKMLAEYPNSDYETRVKRLLAESREKLALHELEVAKFYAKQGQAKAAAYRLASLEKDFGDTDQAKTAVKRLKDEYPDASKEVLALLDAELKRQDGIKSENYIPKTPLFIAARDDEMPLLKRFRLAHLDTRFTPEEPNSSASDANDIVSSGVAVKKKENLNPEMVDKTASETIARLACESIDGIAVYTTYFSQDPKVISRSPLKNNQSNVLISTSSKISNELVNQTPKCLLEGSQVALQVNKEQPTRVELTVQVPKGAQYQLLQLDRPSRVVVVVLPNPSKKSP